MKFMTSAEIRQAFLDYFEEMGHAPVASSSLVPGNDPTLLFTNAGMVQFKDVFLGMDQRPYKRATTSQKCMRVSGKHNDLENVGPSPRHHTFFEMLGNFSFGDYFKREACKFAFDLLTKVYGLPEDRLAYTVHYDDQEAFDIWVNHVGVPKERVHRLGDKDNFWMMADVGPCGYTSEIHWDRRPQEGLAGLAEAFDTDNGRFLEIWNLVFMQFEQQPDGSRIPLPAPGVDTGMGLERLVSVIQNAEVNYETDLFMPIIRATQALTGHSDAERDANIIPYRVIADHMRAACFLIADGVRPGPNGRDYVCRMVMRRAMRFGTKLGFDEPFLADVADAVVETMLPAYPYLEKQRETIRKVVTNEERRFSRAMDRGLGELNALLDRLPAQGQLNSDDAFFLHSSLGLPFEITRDVAQERGFGVDQAAFDAAKEAHAQRSEGGAFGVIERGELYLKLLDELKASQVIETGVAQDQYSEHLSRTAKILGLLKVTPEGVIPVQEALAGDQVEVILDITPFYVESGGQISDTGVISAQDGSFTMDVEDAKKPIGGLIVHVGEVVEGRINAAEVTVSVDRARRNDIERNHTATHLLHAALQQRLGHHANQRGSLVTPDRLRFDFSHDAALSTDELHDIERDVNAIILQNQPVVIQWKSLEAARAEGAMALFGEKYGSEVRTVSIGGAESRYSYELCGGNHVPSTAIIGSFHIIAEGAVAQGVRRIEAVTGREAQAFTARRLNTLAVTAKNLGVNPDDLPERIAALQGQIRNLTQEREKMLRTMARIQFDNLKVKDINGVQVLVARVESVNTNTLREMTDWFRDRHNAGGVAVLGTLAAEDGRPVLIAAVTEDMTKRIHAGNLIKEIAVIIGGGGGGKPNMAQAGGKDPAKLSDALDRAYKIIAGALG
jgi:alanyl-tRNA synthetase